MEESHGIKRGQAQGPISECNVKSKIKHGGAGAGHKRHLREKAKAELTEKGIMGRTWRSGESLLQGVRLVLTQGALSA